MFNLKTAQNKQILEEKYLVPQEFSLELEQLLKTINNRGLTKFILNKIRQTPIQNQNQLEEIKRIIQEQNKSIKDPIDEKINNITQNINYKNWIKNLIKIGKIKEEDFLKIKSLLETYNKLSLNKTIPENKRNINTFKDDSELNQYLNQFAQKTKTKLEDIKSGYKILDQNDKVKLLEVTEEETLKQICDVGYNINWCVIHGSWKGYSPQRYYCFIINGKPEVLVHPESGQIKDINDHPLQNGLIISMIDPFMKKFKLDKLPPKKQEEDFEPDDLYDDFEIYHEKSRTMKEFNKNINNEKFIEKELFNNPMNITLLSNDYWAKYIKIIIDNLDKIDYELAPLDLLNYIADYCIINKLNDKFEYLEDKMITLLRILNNFSRYSKIIPEKLKTKRLSNEYKKIIEEITEYIEENGDCQYFAQNWCKNQLENNSEESKKWITKITEYIEKNGECPDFSEDWCEKELENINSPYRPKWIPAINEFIKENGNPPDFAFGWCKNQLENNSEESKKWISRINKYIKENRRYPVFAQDWYKKEKERKKLQQAQAKSSNWYKFYRTSKNKGIINILSEL